MILNLEATKNWGNEGLCIWLARRSLPNPALEEISK